MSELATRLREILSALGASDTSLRRFGAAQHRYELLPRVDDLSAIEAEIGELPEEFRDYVTRVSAGGMGPYYGLIDIARAAKHVSTAAPGVAGYKRALPLSHLGCGYAAVLPLDGPARGQVWIDARAIGLVAPMRPSFTAYVLDWIDRVSTGQWLEGYVPLGACALTAAITGYLGVREQELGIEPGAIAGAALRAALADLPRHAIAIAAEEGSPLFAPGTAVDPCVNCARAIEGLVRDGLRPDVVAPGVRPFD
ncbi:MAG TPA: hypothetical protein VLT45_19935 [Kofleriaceae bacterium]|nr:hypothetical protein [Kofleriaceae bacterium]